MRLSLGVAKNDLIQTFVSIALSTYGEAARPALKEEGGQGGPTPFPLRRLPSSPHF